MLPLSRAWLLRIYLLRIDLLLKDLSTAPKTLLILMNAISILIIRKRIKNYIEAKDTGI